MNDRGQQERSQAWKPRLLAVALGGSLAVSAAHATEGDRNWEFEIGIGTAYAPDYSGSKASKAQLRLWFDGALHSAEWGTFALDSGSLTIDPELRWNFVDTPTEGLGPLIGYRPGRNDSGSGFWKLGGGSTALRGLTNVDGAVDVGVQGFASPFGLPLFAQVRSALNGIQGALVHLGAYAVLPLAAQGELTFLPTATWANARQMRAFYGVGPAQSVASGFAAYRPGAGWQNVALETVADWPIAAKWHVVVSIAYERLLGSAADSPLVAARNQVSGLLGLVWHR